MVPLYGVHLLSSYISIKYTFNTNTLIVFLSKSFLQSWHWPFNRIASLNYYPSFLSLSQCMPASFLQFAALAFLADTTLIKWLWHYWVRVNCKACFGIVESELIKRKSGTADVWLKVCTLFHGHIWFDGCTQLWVPHNHKSSWLLASSLVGINHKDCV